MSAYTAYGQVCYDEGTAVVVAGSRRYRDLLLFQFGAMGNLMSMREVSSDIETAKDLTGKIRGLLEGWSTDFIRIVGENANLPSDAAERLVGFNRDCFAAAKEVRVLEDALLRSLREVELALEKLLTFWQDVQ